MKKKYLKSILVLILFLFCSCGKKESQAADDSFYGSSASGQEGVTVQRDSDKKISFIDSLGNEVIISSFERVVILYGSYAETWILAGGSLVGTTEDAVSERGLNLEDTVSIVGTVKEPNLELLISLNPDFVILSADIASQVELGDRLTEMEISHAYIRVDTFSDYLSFLRICCDITGREDLYQENGVQIQDNINSILKRIPTGQNISILLLRVYSSGAKAKTNDNFTGLMLKELKTENIASNYPSLLEEISMETIITEDPDFIFVITMGEENKALLTLKNTVQADPAWKSLKAVKEGHYIILPKDLFHYKPNARWAEGYEYLAKILYPEQFAN